MRLSYSSISTYQTCPLQFKLAQIDKLPTKRTPALDFGESLHKALHFLYGPPTPQPVSLDELLTHLKKVWRNDTFSGPEEEQAYLDHANQILTKYYESNIVGKDYQIPVALEHYFQIDFNGVTVSGRIDRMDKLPGGGYEIIDYKTNRRLPSLSKVQSDLQLSIYHWAVQETWGITPEKLTFHFLIPDESLSTCRSQDEIEQTKETVARIIKDIENEKFEARENPLCPWCDFQTHCPHFKHLHLREASAEATAVGDEQPDIERAIDQYIELKGEEKRIKERLLELQDVIHRYCERHNITKLYSEKGTITVNKGNLIISRPQTPDS